MVAVGLEADFELLACFCVDDVEHKVLLPAIGAFLAPAPIVFQINFGGQRVAANQLLGKVGDRLLVLPRHPLNANAEHVEDKCLAFVNELSSKLPLAGLSAVRQAFAGRTCDACTGCRLDERIGAGSQSG